MEIETAEPLHNNIKKADHQYQLPLDVIESEILPRLPVKSVGRFNCVSKQWLSFLSTNEFTGMHLRHTVSHKRLLLIEWRSSSCIRIIDSCDRDNSTSSTIITSTPFTTRLSDVLILASLHGLACVCLKKTYELVIWNPLTQAYKKLPISKSHGFYKIGSDVVGLYTDSSNNYKILHVKRRRNVMGAYVSSCGSNSWRKIGFLKKRHHIYNYMWSPVTLSGGSLYFTVKEFCIGGETLIIAFDVNSEKFREIGFPFVPCEGESYYPNLADIEDRIHLFVSHGMFGVYNWELDLWRMDGEKWTKVMAFANVFRIVPWINIPEYVIWNGEWLVVWNGNKDVYKVDTKGDYVCLHFAGGNWSSKLEQTIHIESLVSPNR